ncbi:hypothetical protein [Arthrobacter rhizosphaerae]|uniref:hypothetical protein n=1 Tax=Arthrobacter rhizosphaerae TaxID=2855490 RepID=UPI001FF2F2D1|nr:hypothetical protein [Arthrobacter rhizosphaerae]
MKRLLTPLVLVMLAAGCSAPAAQPPAQTSEAPTSETTPTPVVMAPGKYTFENATGATGTLDIPGQPDPEIEKLRELAGAAPTTYLTVHVDNRKGTVGVNMYAVSIFTPEGKELKYVNADTYIDELRPDDAPAEVYNQFIELGNKHMEMAKPKAVKDFVLVGPTVPDVIAGITVYPTGMSGEVDALPAS